MDHDTWRSQQSVGESLLGWSCSDDCRYFCMWSTVDTFIQYRLNVPQFHGKWPFLRICGVQEPASAFFSILNLASNVYMLRWLINKVPSHAPMLRVWILYSLTAINAWFWSTVFHTRDNDFTEMMDYFCAFSTVLFSLLAYLLRQVGPSHSNVSIFVTVTCAAFFINHVTTMAMVQFDYGYNMKVNIAVGGTNCLAWLGWCTAHWGEGKYIKQGMAAVTLLTLSTLLEVMDFAPWFWMLDSHALWHLATAPLPILWYQFIAGDCQSLLKQMEHDGKVV